MNIKALAVAILAATTLTASAAPEAKAYTTCSTDMWGGTSCNGSGGSFNSSTDMWGNTNYYGTDNYGNSYSGSCSTDMWGGTTCY